MRFWILVGGGCVLFVALLVFIMRYDDRHPSTQQWRSVAPQPNIRFQKIYEQGRYLPEVGFQVFNDMATGQEIACASGGGHNNIQCWPTGRVWKSQ